MKRYAAWIIVGTLLATGTSIAVAADEVRRPAGIRTDLQQFSFPIATAQGGDRYVDPLSLQIINAYGGGIAPRVPDFVYVPVGGDGGGDAPPPGTDPGGGEPLSSGRTQIRIPATAAILPREAKAYVLNSVAMPRTPAHRSETLRALNNLANVPVAQARQMFTAPAFIQSGQKPNFFKSQIQKLASRTVATPQRFAIVVAPAGTEGDQARAFRSAAQATVSFQGMAADALLAGVLHGTVEEPALQRLGTGVTAAIANTGQVWFANGVETVLPHTAAALYRSEDIGGIVTAGSEGAKAVRASSADAVSDAISVYGSALEGKREAASNSGTVQAIVEAVGPAALVSYAPGADDALAAAQAVRANKHFGSTGTVAVLLQGSGGTELLLF